MMNDILLKDSISVQNLAVFIIDDLVYFSLKKYKK
jgi:hypothetical protein